MVTYLQIKRSLITELIDHENAFSNKERSPEDFKELNGHRYVNRVLNTNIYDSIESSGALLELDSDLQKIVTNLYNVIKRKNDLINQFSNYIIFNDDGACVDWKLAKVMEELDEGIKERIHELKQVL